MHNWTTAAGKHSNAAAYAINSRTDSRGTMSSLCGKRIIARDAGGDTAIARDGWPACDAREAVMPCKHDINFLTRYITARQTRRIVGGERGSRQYTRHLRDKRRMSCAGALTNSCDAVSKAATVPTRRTSDQSISIGAHIHAQTTASHARGRRSITVVVRDERPLCATRRSIFGVQTARLGRYVQLLVRSSGRGITLRKRRNESRYVGATKLYPRGSYELTRAFSSHKVARLSHVEAAYRMSNGGGRVFVGMSDSACRRVLSRRAASRCHANASTRAALRKTKRRRRAKRSQSRPPSKAVDPTGQPSVVDRKTTMLVSTAQPRATAAASRASDGAISRNAHSYAGTARWRAGGRRRITVVVRDERPI